MNVMMCAIIFDISRHNTRIVYEILQTCHSKIDKIDFIRLAENVLIYIVLLFLFIFLF